jgi:hypothetical protein
MTARSPSRPPPDGSTGRPRDMSPRHDPRLDPATSPGGTIAPQPPGRRQWRRRRARAARPACPAG